MTYYNEHDPKAAAWLRELIKRGLIPAGDVDERDIQEVRPHDLTSYKHQHFFAGIGGWAYALLLAGWPSDRPVFALEAAPANRSAKQESDSGKKMNATSGPSSAISSPSARLQSRLENRLRARMAAYGSPEYELTWKAWDMQSGPQICALRGSPRRNSDSDFTGWPTPLASDAGGGRRINDGKRGAQLREVLFGWATPTTRDHKDGGSVGTVPVNGLLGRQVWAYSGATGKPAVLSPAFHLWLQGYPIAWHSSGEAAMQSFRSSRQNLSSRAKKPLN